MSRHNVAIQPRVVCQIKFIDYKKKTQIDNIYIAVSPSNGHRTNEP